MEVFGFFVYSRCLKPAKFLLVSFFCYCKFINVNVYVSENRHRRRHSFLWHAHDEGYGEKGHGHHKSSSSSSSFAAPPTMTTTETHTRLLSSYPYTTHPYEPIPIQYEPIPTGSAHKASETPSAGRKPRRERSYYRLNTIWSIIRIRALIRIILNMRLCICVCTWPDA